MPAQNWEGLSDMLTHGGHEPPVPEAPEYWQGPDLWDSNTGPVGSGFQP